MSCIQTRLGWSNVRVERKIPPPSNCTSLHAALSCGSSTPKFQHHKPLRVGAPVCVPLYSRGAPVCVFGGKGNTEGDKEAFSWDSLKKAMEGFRKEPSMQDLLRQKMQEQEYGGDGGDRNIPRDDGDGSGGSEDEGFTGIWDELVQVILATVAFIFVYIYMIRGAELMRLMRDYIKYLLGGRASYRLERTMREWHKFYKSMVRTEVVREDWLEHAIVTTPTWWYRPQELARRMSSED
ncbi:hypothetical protein J5N97_020307 [Dioscorea zingiberensis]|uniref:Uncharacterized protein n=1 Tax=Dioscorea zingiberensis TaxID=325984 RepID=A0A9D5HDP3_9LILI|nr:hypothetical protein J5N97_020307 [Dioscorea zingiberensis]